MPSFSDLVARTNAGEEVRFSAFAGKVVLIVNVAPLRRGGGPRPRRPRAGVRRRGPRCFFPLQSVLLRGAERRGTPPINKHGLPATSLMERADVNGPDTQPVYKFLKSAKPGDIEWNFSKFVVGRDGQVLERFGQSMKPPELEQQLPVWLG